MPAAPATLEEVIAIDREARIHAQQAMKAAA
jgi:hypothetical protein